MRTGAPRPCYLQYHPVNADGKPDHAAQQAFFIVKLHVVTSIMLVIVAADCDVNDAERGGSCYQRQRYRETGGLAGHGVHYCEYQRGGVYEPAGELKASEPLFLAMKMSRSSSRFSAFCGARA